jgi:hypothetical protein
MANLSAPSLILMAFAVVFEMLATFWTGPSPRYNLAAAGLACFFLVILLTGMHIF